MATPEPINDGKVYTLPEAQRRQRQLIASQPTGKQWYWVDVKTGQEVVFSY